VTSGETVGVPEIDPDHPGLLTSVLEAEPEVEPTERALSRHQGRDRRRFTYASLCGVALMTVPYLWLLMNDWTGSYDPLRSIPFFNDFYDEQAQAIMHGHLWVPTGSLGIEGFVHGGHTFTYFGLFPSLLRIPFLWVAPSLDGRLTAPSMLAAWLLTALFTSLLIWRVRMMLRGPAVLRLPEAALLGGVVASVQGSVLLFLGAAPWVYDEDIAWSVPLTMATLFVFLGILNRPSKGQLFAAGGLILCGMLGRQSAGLACVVGALIIAAWFWFGRGATEHRRWALPMVIVGVVPFVASCVVNWLKFGTFINGLPLAIQVWTKVNAHRQVFLASTGGKGYSFHFLPTTLWAYFQPFGLRVQSTFPFLTLPVNSPHVFGGYTVDILYPTASVTATMPLLFLSSCWAVVVCFRRRAGEGRALMRIPLIVGAGATFVNFELGYIAPRYLGDFLPFLALGGAIGLIDLWERWEVKRPSVRRAYVGAVVGLALFSLAANSGIAASAATEWTPTQTKNYLQAIKAVSDATGHPLPSQVHRGTALPYWAPANELFVVGNCAGLYLSSGVRFDVVPAFQVERSTWLTVEQGTAFDTTLDMTFNSPLSQLGTGVELFSIGLDTVYVLPAGNGEVQFVLGDPRYPTFGLPFKPVPGAIYPTTIVTNTVLHMMSVTVGGSGVLSGLLSGATFGTPVVLSHQPSKVPGLPPPLTVRQRPNPPADMSLCRSLLKDR
jgi:hypothetical protein